MKAGARACLCSDSQTRRSVCRFLPIPVTPLMIIRCIEQKSNGKKIVLTKDWMALDKISPVMPLAVMAAEDQNFEDHFGFDMEAIKKAEEYNKRHQGKRLKGASTITQQTAKNAKQKHTL